MALGSNLVGASTELGVSAAVQYLLDHATASDVSKLKDSLESARPDDSTKDLVIKFLEGSSVDASNLKMRAADNGIGGYNQKTKEIILATGDKAVALHEAGHFVQHAKHPFLSEVGAAVSRYTPVALAANAAIAEFTDNKAAQAVHKFGPAVLLASAMPELALEYDASRRAKAFLEKHYPESYSENSAKLDKAFASYARNAVTAPLAWSAGSAARGMMKKAGVVGTVARGTGRVLGWGARQVANQAKATTEVIRDIRDAPGVKAKASEAFQHLVGKDTQTSGKVMRGVALGMGLMTPAYAAMNIAEVPKSATTWGREIGRVGGEVLGAGTLIGSPVIGHAGSKYGERLGKKVDELINAPLRKTTTEG